MARTQIKEQIACKIFVIKLILDKDLGKKGEFHK